MDLTCKDKIKEQLQSIVEAYKKDRKEEQENGRSTGNTKPKMVVDAQLIYRFIYYDCSELFPDNPNVEWDSSSYGSFLTCDTCYTSIMKQLIEWYESN